ncbi:unnamed protein product [Hermetia illucens]|uniref:Uncharacterized protein n=1 Tax=Hermetia illucens TaxID=343691 RepID=A0A7R8V605_HERIL|nr:uncharacterized protein LOC119659962 [Hermetia illucens]CAD7093556.1 unnamed protein product [Hermetia illucens]
MKTVVLAVLAFTGLVDCDVSHLVAGHAEARMPAPGRFSGTDPKNVVSEPPSQAQLGAEGAYSESSQAHYVDKVSQNVESAQTTFIDKQILLEHIREQIAEAQLLLRNEINQLQIAQVVASEAANSAGKTSTHLSILSNALSSAQEASFHAQEAARDSADEVSSQSDMVIRAKYRLRELEERLNLLSLELSASKTATARASGSDHHGQKSADSIGYASHKSQESIAARGSTQIPSTKSSSVH